MNLTEATIKALSENEEKLVTVPYDLLYKIVDSLGAMASYMDDGMADRNDPDYSDYFEVLDSGRDYADKLWQYLSK